MWKKIETNVKTFLSPYEDETITVVEVGTTENRKLVVVSDDAYETKTGATEILTYEQFKEKYGFDFRQIT